MSNIYYLFFAGALVGVEFIYFRLARSYGILDHPNTRSLHEKPTIRGGGVIFYLAALLFFAVTFRPSPLFFLSLTLVSTVGFVDDIRSLSSLLRLFVQSIAVALLLIDLQLSGISYWVVFLIFIVSVGALNTFNFMDGINGLTGGYGLVTIGSLLYVNIHEIHFMESDFALAILIALLIFSYFNFRGKAVCFAGDVGSLSIGLIIIYLVIKLVVMTGNYAFVFLLTIYGVDSVLTIIHRLLRKENIFKPHKLHLYQVIVNNSGISHVQMSSMYLIIQLVINSILIACMDLRRVHQFEIGAGMVVVLGIIYVVVKSRHVKAELN